MQDRYTGDIGDYAKYGLLRALANGRQLGVAWYLFPDENHNYDGRHIKYLHDRDQWRGLDCELFDVLKRIVIDEQRSVDAVEKSDILGAATKFSGEIVPVGELTPAQRRVRRGQWFEDVQTRLQGCDIVFADPDNGLYEDEKFKPGQAKHWKRIPLSEARALANGRTAVIYHHNTRRAGGHVKEIEDWIALLGAGTLALRWRAYSPRTFFIVNPARGMNDQLMRFSNEWGPRAEFHGLSR